MRNLNLYPSLIFIFITKILESYINWMIYKPCPESHCYGEQEITMNGFVNIIAIIKTSFVINCLNLEIMRLSQGELSDKMAC